MLFDYISPEKISEIVEDEIRCAIRSQIKKESDIERVLTYFTAEYIFKLMESEWTANAVDFEKALKEAINNAIESDHVKYYVFRRKDAWDRTESPAVKILDPYYKIDFETSMKQYDAIQLHLCEDNPNNENYWENLYFKLYGWDCDSILIMNPSVIVCKATE